MNTQLTTIVQQIDTQGPVVVERISTQFADVACTPANARLLVEGLHGGTAITLSADGKTATFTPTVHLGYGDAYIALALAAEALRNAGVTGCATPDQWQAVLLGGPLAAAGTTTTSTTISSSASSSSRFPGILTLHSQGQGWGQVAQTTNVQLGQVVSNARSSFKMNASDSTNLSPTGRTSLDKNSYPPTSAHPSADKKNSSSDKSGSQATGDITPSTRDDLSKPQTKGRDTDTDNGASAGASAGAGSSSGSSTSSKP